jgi:hypothetical protein
MADRPRRMTGALVLVSEIAMLIPMMVMMIPRVMAMAEMTETVAASPLFQSSSVNSLAIHHTNEYTGIASTATTPIYIYHGIEIRSDMILE